MEAIDGISRRDLLRLTGRVGISSMLMAAGALGGAASLPSLARAAESTYGKRWKNEPKHTLKFSASGARHPQGFGAEGAGELPLTVPVPVAFRLTLPAAIA